MLTVRKGTAQDIPVLAKIGEHFAELQPYRHAPMSHTAVVAALTTSLRDGLLVVAEHHSYGVVGALVGISGHLWYDPSTKVATEITWWIEPAHRNGRTGLQLVEMFEQLAKQSGHDLVAMMFLQNLQPERLARLYERNGYKLTEQTYIKEI